MTRCLSLAEFWYLAEHVTGISAATLIKASRVELADSALHAPRAGFGDTDFYPDVYDKAAGHHQPEQLGKSALPTSRATGWLGIAHS